MRYIFTLTFIFNFLLPVIAEDYPIRLNKKYDVGFKYKFFGVASEDEHYQVRIGGSVVSEEKNSHSIDFEGIVEIIEINKKKVPRELAATVRKCTYKRDEEFGDIAQEGEKIIIKLQDGAEIFQIGSKPAGKYQTKLLDFIFSLDTGDTSEDEMYGTNSRKSKGDFWPINKKLVIEKLSRNGFIISDSTLSGKTRFEDIIIVKGEKYLKLVSKINVSKMEIPVKAGIESTARMNVEVEFLVSADGSGKKIKRRTNVVIHINRFGKPNEQGPAMLVETNAERIVTLHYSELAPGEINKE